MKIIWIDVGKKGGIAVYDTAVSSFVLEETFSFSNNVVKTDVLSDWKDSKWRKKKIRNINAISVYMYLCSIIEKNSIVLIGEAMGQAMTVKVHSKFYWIIELVAQQKDSLTIYVNDNSVRKVVLWPWNGNKKEMTHEVFKWATPDISDAKSFVDWYLTVSI